MKFLTLNAGCADAATISSNWREDWKTEDCFEQGSRPNGPTTRRLYSPVAGADAIRPAEDEKVRFGFHNLRHSLATDVKMVQKDLHHSDVTTTLGIYAHSMSQDRLAGQDEMLAAMMTPSNAVN